MINLLFYDEVIKWKKKLLIKSVYKLKYSGWYFFFLYIIMIFIIIIECVIDVEYLVI